MEKKAFTLVELIVVIIILAILATIAFVSYNGYISSSRDSVRLADIKNITTSMEAYIFRSGSYPEPSGTLKNISYSGFVLFKQGTIGESLIRTTGVLSKIPLDPLTQKEYGYSLAKNQYKISYELSADVEGSIAFDDVNIINPFTRDIAYGQAEDDNIYVKSNYNGYVLKAYTGGIYYAITSPSITVDVQTNGEIDITSLTGVDLAPNLSVNFVPQVVWTGASLILTKVQPFIDSVQASFTGVKDQKYANLLSSSGSTEIDLGKKIFADYLGGEINETGFRLSDATIYIGKTVATITDNCTEHPTYSVSDPAIATLANNSTISGAGTGGTINVTATGGNCGDSSPKTLTILKPVDGVCGNSNGALLTSMPTADLCAAGNTGTVSDASMFNYYNWTCEGINTGSGANCSAIHASPKYNPNFTFNTYPGFLTLQSDGTFFVGGQVDVNGKSFFKVKSDGTFDTSFKGLPSGGYPSCAVIQDDGKVLVCNGSVKRLLPDTGTGDTTFNHGALGGEQYANIHAIALQSNGNILVGGQFKTIGGVTTNGLARLTPTGALDNTLDTGTGFTVGGLYYNPVWAIAAQGDKILVGGTFTSYRGVSINNFVRLTSTGDFDTTFNVGGTGFDGRIEGIKVLADGRILVTGTFNKYNGIPIKAVAILSSSGVLDTSFNTSSSLYGWGTQTEMIPNGSVYAGTFVNGTGTGFTRLTPTGSIDSTFNPGGAGVYGNVHDFAVQPDGKIIILGSFSRYNGDTTKKYLIRINSDGSLDQ